VFVGRFRSKLGPYQVRWGCNAGAVQRAGEPAVPQSYPVCGYRMRCCNRVLLGVIFAFAYTGSPMPPCPVA
jgi:hypothetical protein